MPTLFVSGELLGASELSDIRRDLSLASLVDLLIPGPSATPDGFFCSWRVALGSSQAGSSVDHGGRCVGSSVGRDAAVGQWRVARGVASGQTQTHLKATPSVDALAEASTLSCSALDAVWAHPIELQLAWEPSAPGALAQMLEAWPRLELTVWSVDSFQRARPYGRGSVAIPMAAGELALDVPIVLERPRSVVAWLARALGVPLDEKSSLEHRAAAMVLDVVGTARVRLGVVPHGFGPLDVQCA